MNNSYWTELSSHSHITFPDNAPQYISGYHMALKIQDQFSIVISQYF